MPSPTRAIIVSSVAPPTKRSRFVRTVTRDAERSRDAGRLLEAIGALHDARALVPDRLDVLPHLGALYAQAGRRSDAINVYQMYLAKRPKAKDAREMKTRIRALRDRLNQVAARELGLTEQSLRYRLRKYELIRVRQIPRTRN